MDNLTSLLDHKRKTLLIPEWGQFSSRERKIAQRVQNSRNITKIVQASTKKTNREVDHVLLINVH